MGKGYAIHCPRGSFEFDTKEEFEKFRVELHQHNLNDQEYARNNPTEKKHIIFHGGCTSCVTPIHYGLGNCTGCMYFDFVANSHKPSLKIENFIDGK